ncbi:DEAD/DEAH box helicase [Oscillospiraceae bacterium MB08-C2-2]|nr:DEAD/DEAH box helicase [Oscillospiraceae bacterium MB08-C2-2]
MEFSELNIIPPILRALTKEGYKNPTPIQEQAIPPVLERRDLLGCAQTGTGKTAAFAVPILQLLYEKGKRPEGRRPIRALVLTPTRELALQIQESFSAYGRQTGLRSCVVFGGVSQKPQEENLRRGVDVLVATPGRLMDLMNQKLVNLAKVEIFVLDEADRMLDMGFIHDVKKIISYLPPKRQTLLFSATMPPEIQHLVDTLLQNPVKVEITPAATTVDTISQRVYFVDKINKRALLQSLLADKSIRTALVFTRTKHGADRVARDLSRANITSAAIHGDKSQGARQLALTNFKNGKLRVLVATDIAARGIDIDQLSHVINYDLPNIPETYVHRIGRTGRAGLSGIAISFCDVTEKPYLKDIQKLIRKDIPVVGAHPFPMTVMAPPPKEAQASRPPRRERAEQAPAMPRPERSRRGKGAPGAGTGKSSSRFNRPPRRKSAPRKEREE